MPKKFEDLTGQRFGKLIVLRMSDAKTGKNRDTLWDCLCDCGNIKNNIGRSNLKRGTVLSCGCNKKLKYGESSFNKLFCEYKYSAKKRNLDFSISIKLFYELTQKNCFYCGVEPRQIKKVKGSYGEFIYNGIDRIDSSIGYIEKNVVSCCGRCNMAKGDMSQNDFISWIDIVHKHLYNK